MSTTDTKHLFPRPQSTRPEHQATGRHYPGEWAHRFELYLDQEPRRAAFFGTLFAVFVLTMVISAVVRFSS